MGVSPVDPPVVVVSVEELDLLEGLLAGVVTGQVWMHAQEEVEGRGPWRRRRAEDGHHGHHAAQTQRQRTREENRVSRQHNQKINTKEIVFGTAFVRIK